MGAIIVRPVASEDQPVIREMLVASAAFSAEEVEVAMEMVRDDAGQYSLPGIEIDGTLSGYACIGRAPLTLSCWYIYWICVHRSHQRTGLGLTLQTHIEQLVRDAGGTRLVLETSGRADYENARRFYRRAGFTEAGRIPDFYKPGDDCVIYWKTV